MIIMNFGKTFQCFCQHLSARRGTIIQPGKLPYLVGDMRCGRQFFSPIKRYFSINYSHSKYANVKSKIGAFTSQIKFLSTNPKAKFTELFLQRISTSKHQLFGQVFSRTLQTTTKKVPSTVLTSNHKTVLLYLTSAAVIAAGLSYAAVPLYRIYCQASGYGGTTKRIDDIGDKIENMERIKDRMLKIRFEAGTNRKLQWKFKPQQKEVKLVPGETALAFYTAINLTDRPIIGIATYNVIPFDAGQYFNKIQCFCFEEQQLNPNEEVDMPVFFYIDPDFDEDPKMAKVDEIILSYTFFESNDLNAPLSSPHDYK